jgi:hypothetical protein
MPASLPPHPQRSVPLTRRPLPTTRPPLEPTLKTHLKIHEILRLCTPQASISPGTRDIEVELLHHKSIYMHSYPTVCYMAPLNLAYTLDRECSTSNLFHSKWWGLSVSGGGRLAAANRVACGAVVSLYRSIKY